MHVQTAKELGLLIRDRRLRRGLGQQELASLVGVGRQWISEVEHGKPRAEIGLVLKTLRALGVSVEIRDVPQAPRGISEIDAIVDAARRPRRRDVQS